MPGNNFQILIWNKITINFSVKRIKRYLWFLAIWIYFLKYFDIIYLSITTTIAFLIYLRERTFHVFVFFISFRLQLYVCLCTFYESKGICIFFTFFTTFKLLFYSGLPYFSNLAIKVCGGLVFLVFWNYIRYSVPILLFFPLSYRQVWNSRWTDLNIDCETQETIPNKMDR